jgi:hypothetical protein
MYDDLNHAEDCTILEANECIGGDIGLVAKVTPQQVATGILGVTGATVTPNIGQVSVPLGNFVEQPIKPFTLQELLMGVGIPIM